MLLCMVVIPLAAHAQGDALSKRISLNLNSATVVEFFDEMKKQTGLNFIISSELQQQLPTIGSIPDWIPKTAISVTMPIPRTISSRRMWVTTSDLWPFRLI